MTKPADQLNGNPDNQKIWLSYERSHLCFHEFWWAVLKPLLDPDVADVAPNAPILTGYDEERLLTYIRLLDAAAEDADWREVARIVLHIDPEHEPERAFKSWETHLARARWMTTSGYRYLLAGGAPH